MEPLFELHEEGRRVCFEVPTTEAVRCFLQRQRFAYVEHTDDPESETLTSSWESGDDSCFEYGDDAAEWIDGCSDEEDAEITDEEAWFVASLFGIGRYAPTWWLAGSGSHDDTCTCRPLGLLEVLQDHADPNKRQSALEAHLSGLRGIWDHFWSGDALVNGSSDLINGACSNCIAEGREHLSDVLDEARNLAEELGEALAAFHTQIDLGLDRYEH
jgi:hypothetical protein